MQRKILLWPRTLHVNAQFSVDVKQAVRVTCAHQEVLVTFFAKRTMEIVNQKIILKKLGNLSQLLFFYFIQFLFSCSIENKEIGRTYQSYFELENDSIPIINKHDKPENFGLQIEEISLSDFNTSFEGVTHIYNDNIYLIDKLYCWVYKFDKNGKLKDRFLGQGKGPKEIDLKYIDSFAFLENGKSVFIGSSLDIHIYSENWTKEKSYIINWRGKHTYKDIYSIKNPNPSEISLYGFEYEKFIMKSSKQNENVIFVPVYSEHPSFNAFVSKEYYYNGRILAKIDIKANKIIEIEGRRSPIYLDNLFLGHHSFFAFDISSNDHIYIAHEIDPIIYKYDSNFNLLSKFGVPGHNMAVDYVRLKEFDLNQIRYLFQEVRPLKGIYKSIYFYEKENILFRTYSRGGHEELHGLQIYQNGVLLKDITIVHDLEIVGNIDGYFYSNIILDEASDQKSIFRFKL